ncbi:hypothetical protein [Cerasicoccus arenae]|uniref:hypothetical protein n=1 Tax=Cerasicoccus arenae TaxID=424488 RepID=UPI00167268C2|nr:hypothetical protein [Cerasicoccus arenae]
MSDEAPIYLKLSRKGVKTQRMETSEKAQLTPEVDLNTLNHLLHLATESDAELATQIGAAVEFARRTGNRDFTELNQVVEQLLRLHLQGRRHMGVAHCDLTGADDDPLFLRPAIMHALRKVGGCREAIILITGLRQSVCPPGHYFTNKRQQTYNHTQDYIEQLAAKYSSRKTHLRLVFV